MPVQDPKKRLIRKSMEEKSQRTWFYRDIHSTKPLDPSDEVRSAWLKLNAGLYEARSNLQAAKLYQSKKIDHCQDYANKLGAIIKEANAFLTEHPNSGWKNNVKKDTRFLIETITALKLTPVDLSVRSESPRPG